MLLQGPRQNRLSGGKGPPREKKEAKSSSCHRVDRNIPTIKGRKQQTLKKKHNPKGLKDKEDTIKKEDISFYREGKLPGG